MRESVQNIDFVYFDAGFTLIRPEPSIGHHYAAVAREFGSKASPGDLEHAFFVAWRRAVASPPRPPGPPYGRTLDEARLFWAEVVEETFRQSGSLLPSDPAFHEALFDRFAQAEAWTLYDDVEPALALLEERAIPFGILSNWDMRLPLLLDRMGLAGRFRAIVVSSEAGAEKPDPSIFAHAARKAGVSEPRRLALIGDDADADGAGASGAGWHCCLVDRGTVSPVSRGVPSAVDLVTAVRLILDAVARGQRTVL